MFEISQADFVLDFLLTDVVNIESYLMLRDCF